MSEQDEQVIPDEFVGYGPASKYLGIARNTLSSYVARGIGPEEEPERRPVGQYNYPVFLRIKLDEWKSARPGQGARTDLAPVPDEFANARATAHSAGLPWVEVDGTVSRGE